MGLINFYSMNKLDISIPRIASREVWENERIQLLKKEKEATKLLDQVRAARKRLPMVKIDKEYVFEGPNGKLSLLDLFENRRQLLVHHFMYFDKTDRFCSGCSLDADQNYNPPFLRELFKRSVTLVAISRAPWKRIEQEIKVKEWRFPFYSTLNKEFNYDFQATINNIHNRLYNFQEIENAEDYDSDMPAKSVFLQHDGEVYHAYSAYTRGLDLVGTHYNYLDLTPYGRQETWEDAPEGWPKHPMDM
jgi:predicted dithiol-disulfide oxidoreductase (DUF899 family)